MRLPVLLASTLLALAPSLAGCGDDTATVAAGDVIKARQDDQFDAGRRSSVTLPMGELLIRSAEPVDSVAAEDTRSREPVDPPSGMVLVPITWQWDPWSSDRLDGIVATSDTPLVDLVTDGEHYRLPPPDRSAEGGDSFYVVVDGAAEDRRLELEFDGVTQSVDLTDGEVDEGEAAGLYEIDQDALKKSSCDEDLAWFSAPIVSAEFTCGLVGPVLTPYAGGEWAPDGSQWLAVTLSTRIRIYGVTNLIGGGAQYRATQVRVTPEIDGEEPAFVLSTEDGADVCPDPLTSRCGWSKHLIFEVPDDDGEQGPLDVKVSYKLRLINAFGGFPAERKIRATAKEELKIWSER